eukprot:CAMPEP_0170515280 /NCGR_PEP_ID=MMETSP0209-20121228/1726_1 /TAXON_ID=665100 ORGANISM="Litonotus pictus, Strain P1" /NCGR_SAMPLE_ID=MMETSP0209 /ASSEMBLY_ACC=CAM_ASM_000301 /LENGTH=95 /DNA_ID=CAMNT_0010799681 /DNA_START=102 /DNA_END=389 /DNA_ORIENTATION=+
MEETNTFIKNDDQIDSYLNRKNKEFIITSEEYIRIFRSVPNNKLSHEEFYKVRETVNQCYNSMIRFEEKNFESNLKELNYLVNIKMMISLGLKVV